MPFDRRFCSTGARMAIESQRGGLYCEYRLYYVQCARALVVADNTRTCSGEIGAGLIRLCLEPIYRKKRTSVSRCGAWLRACRAPHACPVEDSCTALQHLTTALFLSKPVEPLLCHDYLSHLGCGLSMGRSCGKGMSIIASQTRSPSYLPK